MPGPLRNYGSWLFFSRLGLGLGLYRYDRRYVCRPACHPPYVLPPANDENVLTANGTPPSAPRYQPRAAALSGTAGRAACAVKAVQAAADIRRKVVLNLRPRRRNAAAGVLLSPCKGLNATCGGGKTGSP